MVNSDHGTSESQEDVFGAREHKHGGYKKLLKHATYRDLYTSLGVTDRGVTVVADASGSSRSYANTAFWAYTTTALPRCPLYDTTAAISINGTCSPARRLASLSVSVFVLLVGVSA